MGDAHDEEEASTDAPAVLLPPTSVVSIQHNARTIGLYSVVDVELTVLQEARSSADVGGCTFCLGIAIPAAIAPVAQPFTTVGTAVSAAIAFAGFVMAGYFGFRIRGARRILDTTIEQIRQRPLA